MAFLTDLEFMKDFITGNRVPLVGAELNRQQVEQYLVEVLGYEKDAVEVDRKLEFIAAGEPWKTKLDLVVRVGETPVMVIKCAAGSLGSREKEAVSAARIAFDVPVPLAVVSDGNTALVFDTLTRKQVGEGLSAIPTPARAAEIAAAPSEPLAPKELDRARIVFRSYDSMNINR
ncbi:type I restriction enzyme HsdR N-terminal domain-containing protein [Desulfoluna butyratoxydans]|uniref:Type i restriction enzyme r protein n-terminal domain n=1 Tax=Desulfoluna butyratoxydans TaxID=231438 RepID=A0A4U8YIR8_9BACT|nr:type I restriction enzyme HsdR N-terminal domain-containing protein [Desulfoluna butyratoxydans]VFQ43576.1 type i restriction enzyme r protein n-terminal domain [Desulfoluna butyratoxydans]